MLLLLATVVDMLFATLVLSADVNALVVSIDCSPCTSVVLPDEKDTVVADVVVPVANVTESSVTDDDDAPAVGVAPDGSVEA